MMILRNTEKPVKIHMNYFQKIIISSKHAAKLMSFNNVLVIKEQTVHLCISIRYSVPKERSMKRNKQIIHFRNKVARKELCFQVINIME